MNRIDKFGDWLNEASLEGNIGLPGEESGSGKYRRGVERKAGSEIDAYLRQNPAAMPQFMQNVSRVRAMQTGKERQLEQLAEDAIRSMYGSILDGVDLKIKLVTNQGEMRNMMQETPDEPAEMPELEELTDREIISEIQKRKIANNITQGEAKNTKLVLNTEEVRDGLISIFGEREGAVMIDLLNKITNTASAFDWKIPIEQQKQMWQSRSGFAGSVKVDWVKKDQDAEELAQKILSDLEQDEDAIQSEDTEELFNEVTPTITALGTDFAMLLHETVKGIYELIAAVGIPEDEETARTVIMNTDSLADELEDLRYGPYIAADLRDFINELPEAEEIQNFRERFVGKLMAMPAMEYLETFNGILLSRFDPAELEDFEKSLVKKAIRTAKSIAAEIKEELEQYYSAATEYGEEDDEEVDAPEYEMPARGTSMSKDEINDAIIDAYQRGDMEEVNRLSKMLGESFRMPRLKFLKRV